MLGITGAFRVPLHFPLAVVTSLYLLVPIFTVKDTSERLADSGYRTGSGEGLDRPPGGTVG